MMGVAARVKADSVGTGAVVRIVRQSMQSVEVTAFGNHQIYLIIRAAVRRSRAVTDLDLLSARRNVQQTARPVV